MRTIDPNIWRDDWFIDLQTRGQLLWLGILTKVADDQGRFVYNAPLIKADLFPTNEDITVQDVNVLLICFVTDGRLFKYSTGEKTLLQIVRWWKYQSASNWMSPSKHPAPDGWTDCWRYHGKGNALLTSPNWSDKHGGFASLPSQLGSPLGSPLGSELSSGNGSNDVNGDVNVNNNVNDENSGKEDVIENTATLAKLYEGNIGALTQIIAEELKLAALEYPPSWYPDAFKIAVENNARNWKYVRTVMNNWKTNGRDWKPEPKPKGKPDYGHNSKTTPKPAITEPTPADMAAAYALLASG